MYGYTVMNLFESNIYIYYFFKIGTAALVPSKILNKTYIVINII